jgi:hypothetical protein
MNNQSSSNRFSAMSFNLIWYTLIFIWIILYFVIPNIISAYNNLTIVFKNFSGLFFFSPSAYLFFLVTASSIYLPVQLMLIVPNYFEKNHDLYNKRYLWTILTILAIIILIYLQQILIWGSFPIGVENGLVHIRMIPFFPWPNTPLF